MKRTYAPARFRILQGIIPMMFGLPCIWTEEQNAGPEPEFESMAM